MKIKTELNVVIRTKLGIMRFIDWMQLLKSVKYFPYRPVTLRGALSKVAKNKYIIFSA